MKVIKVALTWYAKDKIHTLTDTRSLAYLPLGHLGHAPLTFERSRIGQNATLEKFPLFCMFLYYIHKKTTQCSKHHGEEGRTEVKMEYWRWQEHWRRFQPDERLSYSVLDALEVFIYRNLGTFPHSSTLLQIFATLPVTTSSSERSFSAALKFTQYFGIVSYYDTLFSMVFRALCCVF